MSKVVSVMLSDGRVFDTFEHCQPHARDIGADALTELCAQIKQQASRISELEYEAGIVRPVAAGDASYPNARDVAHTLRNCSQDLLTEARFVLWQGHRIASLEATAAGTRQAVLSPEQIESLVKDYCCVPAGDLSSSSMVATEEAMRDALNAAQSLISEQSSEQQQHEPALTADDIERQYENGVHVGSGLPRATCPCGFCQKHRYGFNRGDNSVAQSIPTEDEDNPMTTVPLRHYQHLVRSAASARNLAQSSEQLVLAVGKYAAKAGEAWRLGAPEVMDAYEAASTGRTNG